MKKIRQTTKVFSSSEEPIGKAIFECLKNNDPEGVMKVISEYILSLNKTKIVKYASIPKTTLYHSLRYKNPTIKTLAKLIYASTSQLES